MAELGTAAKFIEVAQAEVGTIEGPKDNETKYGKWLIKLSKFKLMVRLTKLFSLRLLPMRIRGVLLAV